MPTLPKWLSEVGWRTVIGAVLLGGIIHITATLAVPLVSSGHAFAKLRDTLPGQPHGASCRRRRPASSRCRYLAPDALYAMCRYDISVDSLVVTAAMARRRLDAVAAHPAGRQLLRHAGAGAAPRRRIPDGGAERRAPRRVRGRPAPRRARRRRRSPRPRGRGCVVVRAPLKGLAWRAETEAAAASRHLHAGEAAAVVVGLAWTVGGLNAAAPLERVTAA